MTTETATVDNGVDVEALLGARAALTETPELAQFTFRATNTWLNGAHSVSHVETFYGLSDEQSHSTTFEFHADHPLQFAATDAGAIPVEIVLVALGSCLTGGMAAIAQNRGIQLRAVTATVEADQDLRGILGEPSIRNGFSAIRVNYDIDADASDDDIAALLAQAQKRSAVFDMLTNPTDVTVSVG